MRREPNPFWDYSLEAYGVAAVADACLSLQDRVGADVNLLLFCCWQGSLGHALSKPFLRKAMVAVADWQRQIVLPLRQVRRYIKAGIPAVPVGRTEPLRQAIAAVELDAEYLEQALLAQFAAGKSFAVRRPKPEAVIIANLRRYLELLDIRPEPSTQRQLEMLQEACRSKRAA